MAAKKKTKTVGAGTKAITISTPQAKPIVLRETKVVERSGGKRSGGKRRSSGGGGGGGNAKQQIIDTMVSAGGYAVLQKTGLLNSLPEMPVGGRDASAALVAYLFGGKWRKYAAFPAGLATFRAFGGVVSSGGGVQGWGQPGVAAVMP
jgi:hypothetical protein